VEKITKEMAAEDERIENMVGNYLEQLRKKSVSWRLLVEIMNLRFEFKFN
jgi:hypothetical protein